MRLIHTSDWHLGLSTGPTSRIEEQGRFLEWLLGTLETERADALLIAGDVFDTMHPSSEAQSLYYHFLARAGASGVRDIVVIGGNHDSGAQLDAPRDLLETLNVHVIGSLPPQGRGRRRLVIPLRARGSDDVAALCLAVPYVHEYRLGIRSTDLSPEGTRAAFKDAFAGLYAELVEEARAIQPDLPIIAMGHLTVGPDTKRSDYPQEIHQVGAIEGLPVEIFDEELRYVALGHIHQRIAVNDRVWYSGSPIPYATTEMRRGRVALMVDVDASEVEVTEVPIPLDRQILKLVGRPDDVVNALRDLTWTTPMPPLVHVHVETELAEPGLMRRLQEAIDTHGDGDAPILVDVRMQTLLTLPVDGGALAMGPDEMTPTSVFELLCTHRAIEGEARATLTAAFNEVRSLNDEATLQRRLDDIVSPASQEEESP